MAIPAGALDHIYEGAGPQRANALAPAPEGGWLLAGYTAPAHGKRGDLLVILTDPGGGERWRLELGERRREEAGFAALALEDGGWPVAGRWRVPAGSRTSGNRARSRPA
jgi:hypothetical protein